MCTNRRRKKEEHPLNGFGSVAPLIGDNLLPMIPEIDIWRAATLMLRRYGD
jgi:hypothetical protein